MHLSTSNSSGRQAGKFHIVLLLLLCVVFCAAVEGVTALLFGRVSRVENRRETEYRAASAIQSAKPRHKNSVLVAGNSLLLQGVDFPELRRSVGPGVELNRTVFENTFYLDWYYGLNRLFRAGARPDVVALVLSPWQLITDSTNGDYSVQMLVDEPDLLRFVTETGANRNETSVILLDKASYFYGTRAEIRSWIVNKILPDLPALTRHFRFNPVTPHDENIVEIAGGRLERLRDLCKQNGAQFVLIIPPAKNDAGIAAVAQAGAEKGVSVLIPIPVLPGSDYSDNVHLNSEGAAKFTAALSERLREALVVSSTEAHVKGSGLISPGVPTQSSDRTWPAASEKIAMQGVDLPEHIPANR
jgi:hypothetical protein